MDKKIIQKYINNFRIRLTPYLKPNISIEIKIYNCGQEGAVLIILFRPGGKSVDKEISTYHKISDVLSNIKQDFIGGSISGVKFSGTNMMMDPERIIIIKDNNPSEWNKQQITKDIHKIIYPPSKPNNL